MSLMIRALSRQCLAISCAVFLLATVSAAAAAPQESKTGFDPSLFKPLKWRNIGPTRGGRSVAVAGVAGNPLVYYMGATGGGIWKTEDGGLTWSPIADSYLKTGSVGAITVAPSDPNVIYAGMGETCVRGNFSHGDGVYRSVDAGRTWTHLGLAETQQIGRIRVHPANPDLVYVAALGHVHGPNPERGVFRSKDGGQNWEKVLFVDEKTGAVDLAMDPTNPRILYAAFWQVIRTPWGLYSGGEGSGLYKSTDGGDHWQKLERGLPPGPLGKIGVTVSPVRPQRLWASVEAREGGIFRSDDWGESWVRVNSDRSLRQRAWYYSHIYADSRNAETVYVLNVRFHKSNDGGKSYETISVQHGDNHDLWIAPEDNQRMVSANDGGVSVTFNGGRSWTEQDNQPTAQFYHVTTDNQFPYRVYGAQQDNSTVSISSRGKTVNSWNEGLYSVGGGESGYIAVHPENPQIVYAGSYGGYLTRYDHRTGQRRNITVHPDNPMGWGADELKYRFQWTFPILISRHNPERIYVGANVLFQSDDEGRSWTPISPDLTRNDKSKQEPSGGPITRDNTSVEYYDTIFALAESPHSPGTLWAGTDDGLVQLTRDQGKSWSNVTPEDLPEWSRVSLIEASPHQPGKAYVAANRYQLDDRRPYIFKTTDFGNTWTSITNGIAAEAFVRAVREDPDRPGLLYAGTETGVYVSFDDGALWQPLQLNLPVVPITDLVVKNQDLVVATQGRSFWILDDLSPLHQLNPQVASAAAHFFQSRTTHLVAGSQVEFYYSFREKPAETVRLEILDARQQVIQSFESKPKEAAGEEEEEDDRKEGKEGDSEKEDRPHLAVDSGMNRFSWDMRYPGPERVPGAILWGTRLNGPRAIPGTYQARLSFGDQTLSRPFTIEKDPRLDTSPEDFQQQFDLLIRIRDKVSEAHRAVNRLRGVRRQVNDWVARSRGLEDGEKLADAAAKLLSKLAAIEEEIIQVRSKSPQDPLNFPIKLNNKIAALAAVVVQSDSAPTTQSRAVFEELSGQLNRHLEALGQVLENDLQAFNQLVANLQIPAIVPAPLE